MVHIIISSLVYNNHVRSEQSVGCAIRPDHTQSERGSGYKVTGDMVWEEQQWKTKNPISSLNLRIPLISNDNSESEIRNQCVKICRHHVLCGALGQVELLLMMVIR